MKLALIPQSQSKEIKIILKNESQSWEEIAQNGEAILQTLDKIFKAAKMNITSLDSISVLAQIEASLTSINLAKTVQKSLRVAKKFKTFRKKG